MREQGSREPGGDGARRVPRHPRRGALRILPRPEPQIAPRDLALPQTLPAGALTGHVHPGGHERPPVSGVDPRQPGRQTGPVGPPADRVGAVGGQDEEVVGGAGQGGRGHQLREILRPPHLPALPGHRHVRVERPQGRQRRLHLRPAEVGLAVQGLAVEVGEFDHVRVDAVDVAHTGRDQGLGRVAARAADPHQEDPGLAQAELGVPGAGAGGEVHPAQERHTPAVAVLFAGRQRGRGVRVVHETGGQQIRHRLAGVRAGQLRVPAQDLRDHLRRPSAPVHRLDERPHPAARVRDLRADAVDHAADADIAVDRAVGAVLGFDPGPPERLDRHRRRIRHQGPLPFTRTPS